MHPCENGREIAAGDLRSEKTVRDDDDGDNQENELEGGTSVPPAEHLADERPTKDVTLHQIAFKSTGDERSRYGQTVAAVR